MNISHVSSPHRRPPFPAGRLFLDLSHTVSATLHGSVRRFVALAFSVAALVNVAPAGLVLENGFELGTPDWGATTGVWKPAPADATSNTVNHREGAKSVKFITNAQLNTIRSEFVFNSAVLNNLSITHGTETWNANYDWGTEYWEGFSILVAQPTTGNSIIFQHHGVPHTDLVSAGTGHPASTSPHWNVNNDPYGAAGAENSFTIRTNFRDGGPTANDIFQIYTATDPARVNLMNDSGSATSNTVQANTYPYTRNRWYDFVLHFRLALDNTGIMEVWIKDTVTGVQTKLVNIVGGPTVYKYDYPVSGVNADKKPKTPKNSQKIGVYYNAGSGGEVYYDSIRIWKGAGGSMAAVSPAGGGSAPSAPSGMTATPASSTQINLDWNPVSPTPTGYRVYRGATAGTVTTNVSGNLGSGTTAYNNTGLTAGQTYFYAARAYNGIGESGNSTIVSATTSGGGGGLPSPWVTADIGAVGAAGSATHASGVFTINGSGADIYGTADEFRYVYQTASGDCTIIARVDSVENTNSWAKAGVMIRETTAANAKNLAVIVKPDKGVSFQYRTTAGGTTTYTTPVVTTPSWVKLVRTASTNTFTASRSTNGTSWTTIGSATITMGTSVLIGLPVTSHADGNVCTATISSVTALP